MKKATAKSKPQANPIMEQLKQQGTVILRAKTREELLAQYDDLRMAGANPATGAIGRSAEDGYYTLRLDNV